ncbi:hypothetical protein ACL02R_01575 [Streptomyces sp. MS19]|uniref:hypothetical protein n=1 Tax=Streptomyces sp. MS19 TaxID=3385972 RepID=UPI0039A1ECC2
MDEGEYRDPARNVDERVPRDGQEEQVVRTGDLDAIGGSAAELTASLLAHGRVAEDMSRETGRALEQDGFATGTALTEVADTWVTQERTLRDGLRHVAEHLDASSRITTLLEAEIEEGLRLNSGITGL